MIATLLGWITALKAFLGFGTAVADAVAQTKRRAADDALRKDGAVRAELAREQAIDKSRKEAEEIDAKPKPTTLPGALDRV